MGPLYDALKKRHDAKRTCFHMPGHKNRKGGLSWFSDILEFDTTETVGTDNLQDPNGAIAESLKQMASIFGAIQSQFCVNGTTGGIAMALHMLEDPGDTILVQRDCHKSVYSAAVLNRLSVEWVLPVMDASWGIPMGVHPKTLDETLIKHPKCRVVVVTSPNYYGVCSNISGLVDVAHKHGALLLVDEAHGSHLHFSDAMPQSALQQGADMVVQSTHKTLPALTQASILHTRIPIERSRWLRAQQLFQTTSPSYLLMTAVEQAVLWMDGDGRKALAQNVVWAEHCRRQLEAIPGVRVLKTDDTPNGIDPLRLVFSHDALDGTVLMDALYEKGIALEMADSQCVIALASVHNEEKDYNHLVEAVSDIASQKHASTVQTKPHTLHLPPIAMSLQEAFYRPSESIHFLHGYGKICAKAIVPYPPGIPLVVPGERLSQEVLDALETCIKQGIQVLGLSEDNEIEVIC